MLMIFFTHFFFAITHERKSYTLWEKNASLRSFFSLASSLVSVIDFYILRLSIIETTRNNVLLSLISKFLASEKKKDNKKKKKRNNEKTTHSIYAHHFEILKKLYPMTIDRCLLLIW